MSQDGLLSEVERALKERYKVEGAPSVTAVPSTAKRQTRDTRVDQLLLPDSERAKMPLTKEKYLVQEDPQLVLWERETRKFLRGLSVLHEHRVAAVMIYEWATGLRITDLMEAERTYAQGKTTWRADLRKINKVLEYYFGKPYMTWIAGRKVPKAYRMRQGYYVNRHRPLTLTLWVEYTSGLKP
jgi:hypothetical protein